MKHTIFTLSFLMCSFVLMLILFLQITKDYVQVLVKPGDTIWGYAEIYKEEHHLTNDQFVSWVENHNNLPNNTLQVGEKILLPIEKKN